MIPNKKNKMDINTMIILVIIGIFSGILGGMVGVGGGIVIVPALIYFLGFNQLDAQGTSLALIMFPVGILGVMQYYKQGHVDFNIVLFIAIGFVAGSFLGSKIPFTSTFSDSCSNLYSFSELVPDICIVLVPNPPAAVI